jgi:hypothetical protein
MESNQNLQIAQRYAVQLLGKGMFLFRPERKYNYIELNSTETDITLALNELHNIDDAWTRLTSDYNFDVSNEAARRMYDAFISRMIEIGAFECGDATLPIYGCAGKTYPMTLSIELTRSMQFQLYSLL